MAMPNLPFRVDRKWFAGGLGGLIGLALAFVDSQWLTTWDMPDGGWEMVVVGLSQALFWVVPPSVRDVVSRVNDGIVRLANNDPTNPTSAIVVPVEVSQNPVARAAAVQAGERVAASTPVPAPNPLR